MRRTPPITLMLVTALVATAGTLTIEHFLHPATAVAQEATSPLDGFTIFPTANRQFNSIFFVDEKTGDIWVYRNEKFREHYRVGTMGEDLEKVKN